MSQCDISLGRLKSCKDATGGLKNIYFVNFGDFSEVSYDVDGQAVETLVDPALDPKPKMYKYELHLGNDLTQNINSSAENGTLYFEQVLSLTLKKLSKEDNVQIQSLAAGHPHILVEDQMKNIFVVGLKNGADVTGGTAVTGNAMGDLNGYTLTFTAGEQILANFYRGQNHAADPIENLVQEFDMVVGT